MTRAQQVSAIALCIAVAGVFAYSNIHASARVGPVVVTPPELIQRLISVNHRVYWVGPESDVDYELTRASNGSIFIRYLPRGVKAGSTRRFLTVATYPFPGAYSALKQMASQSVKLPIPGGIAIYSRGDPNDIHVAFVGGVSEIEVFSPVPGEAARLVRDGRVRPVEIMAVVQPPQNTPVRAGTRTPISDFVVANGIVAGAGAVLGAIGGFILALLSRPISQIEEVALGAFGFELTFETDGWDALDYGTAIAVAGAVGSIAVLILKVIEYVGLI